MSETLHVLSFPHTQTTSAYATCAYTQRVIKFCKMKYGGDRRVILYGPEINEASCDEHVVVVPEERRRRWFGDHDENDINRGGFDWDDPSRPWWSETNARTIGEIRQRMEPTDILCITAGEAQRIIADAIPELTVAEIMVGYMGIIRDRANAFAAFETHSHRHLVYGRWGMTVARPYDTVIPNQFDPDELPYGDGGDYLLYVGRMIGQKGIVEAGQIAEAVGMPLVMAGPGGIETDEGIFAEGFMVKSPHLTYLGAVGVEERAALMGAAAAVIVPTLYCEPFGGVVCEAMMCGSPVLTTDWGAFTETVDEGITGFRFNTLQQAVDLLPDVISLDRRTVRERALERFSLDAVRPRYEEWLERLDGLWTGGWHALREMVS